MVGLLTKSIDMPGPKGEGMSIDLAPLPFSEKCVILEMAGLQQKNITSNGYSQSFELYTPE